MLYLLLIVFWVRRDRWADATGYGIDFPTWLAILLAASLVVAALLPWRFSFRALLIATTLIAVGFTTYKYMESKRRAARDERIAKEVEMEMEVFFRSGGAKGHLTEFVDQYHVEIAKSLPEDIGEFVRMEGTGYSYPVWAVSLSPYLDLRRTAHFTHGTIPMRIIVTKGSRDSEVGKPEPRDHIVYVSHPDLVDE